MKYTIKVIIYISIFVCSSCENIFQDACLIYETPYDAHALSIEVFLNQNNLPFTKTIHNKMQRYDIYKCPNDIDIDSEILKILKSQKIINLNNEEEMKAVTAYLSENRIRYITRNKNNKYEIEYYSDTEIPIEMIVDIIFDRMQNMPACFIYNVDSDSHALAAEVFFAKYRLPYIRIKDDNSIRYEIHKCPRDVDIDSEIVSILYSNKIVIDHEVELISLSSYFSENEIKYVIREKDNKHEIEYSPVKF